MEKNQRSVCDKIFSVISCNPQYHEDAEPAKASSGWVPIVFDDQSHKDQVHRTMVQKPSFKAPEKPTKHVRLQTDKEEGDKPQPTRVFSEYIARAGTKIRADSSVGHRKPIRRTESLNKRVSEYITRAKMRFTTKPSFAEHAN